MNPSIYIQLLIVFTLLTQAACVSTDSLIRNSWLEHPSAHPGGGLAMASCYHFRDELLIHGGVSDQGKFSPFNSQTMHYHLRKKRWQNFSHLAYAPIPKAMQTATGYGDSLMVFGGSSEGEEFTASAHLLNIRKQQWQAFPRTSLDPRIHHSATMIGNRLVIYGGIGAIENLNWGYFDYSKASWHAYHAPSHLQDRVHFVAAPVGDQLMIWGGFVGKEKVAEGFLLDPGEKTWIEVPFIDAPSPRSNARAISFGDQVMIWGGSPADGNANSGAIFDLESTSWKELPAIPDSRFEGLSNPSLTKISNDHALLWGGRFATGIFSQEAWIFNRKTWHWQALDQDQVPAGRMTHCLIASNENQLILFGGLGFDNEGFVNFRTVHSIRIDLPQALTD